VRLLETESLTDWKEMCMFGGRGSIRTEKRYAEGFDAKAFVACWCGLLLLAAPMLAVSIEPVKTKDLIAFCATYESAPESSEGIACVHYIKGFVAGAVATDDRVARNVARRMSGNDDYFRTWEELRYGRKKRQYEPTYFAEFCIADEIPLRDVVLKVVRDIQDPVFISEEPLARDAVYRALRQDYACEEPED
jgi:hypothetical protein